MKPAIAVLSFCLTLSGCVGNGSLSDADLTSRLAGRTVEYEAPEGLPAERDSFRADGTMLSRFRPWLVPERLGTRRGWWWVENGRLCRSAGPRGESGGSCYDTMIDGDRIVLQPWRDRTLFQIVVFDVPDMRRPRVGRFVD